MGVKLLDCTLRDGGYVNDWKFGKDVISGICQKSVEAGIDIVELGFLRDISYDQNNAVFDDVRQADRFINKKKKNVLYAVMCEALNPLSIEKIVTQSETKIDVIRVIIWKRLLKEGFEYCKEIIKKGYNLCVQPNRVEQYSDEEYIQLIQLFNELNPMAFYVVDSFGLLDTQELLHYADIANKWLRPDIALGYHGHNNLMQAYGATQGFLERKYSRELILDASVYGIGRGAGNLNLEIIAKHLNEKYKKTYDISCLIDIYNQYVKPIYEQVQWGYSPAYYLTALYRCNPMYASYYEGEKKINTSIIERILKRITEEDKIQFSKEKADNYLKSTIQIE